MLNFKKEDLMVSLNLVSGDFMEQVFLEANSRNRKDRKMTGNSQSGFTKGELCLTDLINFCVNETRRKACQLQRDYS